MVHGIDHEVGDESAAAIGVANPRQDLGVARGQTSRLTMRRVGDVTLDPWVERQISARSA